MVRKHHKYVAVTEVIINSHAMKHRFQKFLCSATQIVTP